MVCRNLRDGTDIPEKTVLKTGRGQFSGKNDGLNHAEDISEVIISLRAKIGAKWAVVWFVG